ncbi:hypothetical protein PLESTB_001750200 [Pleodorina starrii]|uniref:PPM-type phosphatase domain-containing protein n=1 Tax=Pleodorina starrii TaxID=330485 RepID=A0A9W6C093_9CHLO|nr:hypothetical protein PLESTM_000709700 [Pleodorina starrii]GLC61383.1 hypothetical protein PLESTB_001750200 [Pleodorina starrii]GLC67537.1 hypothetical protein PLESTF_000568200 [Pleodorina starrii]
MFLDFFRHLGARLKEQSAVKQLECGTLCGKQGADGEPPEANLHLSKPNTTIVASHSGPDTGVAVYKQFAADLPATWDNPVEWAYGISVSMYDLGPTGRRNGEPVADCFGILAYPEGAILAVADGVNWGEPPRRAARCAVLGCLNHMHHALKQHEGNSALDCHTVFRHLVDSLSASQKLILQQFGTLTTLVVSVVLPLKWVRHPDRWAAITMTVGDSAAYVYRRRARTVEEVTAAAHAEGARDPRWCPGALGYAMGEEPDLANMMLCLTFLEEGDFIFLTSDGVADNFDPVIRKMARHQILESADNDLPALSPAECQAKAMDLLRDVIVEADQHASSSSAAAAASSGPTHGSSSAAAGFGHHPGLHGHQGMTARGLAEHLLQHVYDVTEEQRQHVEARNRERERSLLSREPGAGGGGGGPSLNTDLKHGGLMGMAPAARPPGKMDHATVATYQVGRRKPSAVTKSRARMAELDLERQNNQQHSPPFLVAQAAAVPPARPLAPPGAGGGAGGGGNGAPAAAAAQAPRQQGQGAVGAAAAAPATITATACQKGAPAGVAAADAATGTAAPAAAAGAGRKASGGGGADGGGC